MNSIQMTQIASSDLGAYTIGLHFNVLGQTEDASKQNHNAETNFACVG